MKTKRLYSDEKFKEGFQIVAVEHANVEGDEFGDKYLDDILFPDSKGPAKWQACQWYSKYCLLNDRVPSDPYTITDGKTKWLIRHPETNSLSMRLNARNVYQGHAHTPDWGYWPHLLLEQKYLADFKNLSQDEFDMYSADCTKTDFSIDLRMTDFVDSNNKEGINACQFLAYFYLTLKEDIHKFIWFGFNLFDDRGAMDLYWKMDCTGAGMIYLLSTEETYSGDLSKSFINPNGRPIPSDKWHEVRIDLGPHIDRCIEISNRDNTFGRQVSRKDFYIRGNNIGFEIHGNYDCTFEIKNYNIEFGR